MRSNKRAIRALCVVLVACAAVVLLGASACKSEPAPAHASRATAPAARTEGSAPSARQEPAPTTSHGGSKVPESNARDHARRWLEALQRQDVGALAQSTHFPFEVHATHAPGACPRTASRATELAATVACLTGDSLLMDELRQAEHLGFESVVAPPSWALPWMPRVPEGSALVVAFINGDGITFRFLFGVKADGVMVVVKDAEVESG